MKKFLVGALAASLMLSATSSASAAKFKDVPDSHSLNIEIEYLVEQGVIGGYSDGTFKPNAPISKKHIAKMLVEALEIPTTNLKNPGYKDVPLTHPYYEEIAAAYTAGIFGKADYFKPESSISRAFMAKILSKSFNLKSIADNAVTYKDVAKTSEFYSPIQLVTMNNVAQGYESADGSTYTFKPNQLLTRAHFSAFLARAMSLQTGNYTPNTAYTYYYSDGEETYHLDYTGQERDGNKTYFYWDLFDENNQLKEHTVYLLSPSEWLEGVQESDVGTFADLPATVGLKYDYLHLVGEGPGAEKRRIVETDATIKIDDTTYEHVIIIEDTIAESKTENFVVYTYIAKDYGVIGYGDEDGLGYWLEKRVKR